MKAIIFLICSIVSLSSIAQNRTNDTIPLQNAALSMRYYRKLYGKPSPPAKTDDYKNSIVIINGEKIVGFDSLTKIKPGDITFLKELHNKDTNLNVRRIIMIKTK